jgi:hypothetical protein
MAEDQLKPKNKQIADVMKEEKSRGKRSPAAISAERNHIRLQREFEKLLTRGTEAEFVAAVTRLRLPADSGGLQKLLELFRELRES